MPHVTVKMYAGRSDADKKRLADAITKAVIASVGGGEESVSVGVEDIAPKDWMIQVYEPEIAGKANSLFKRPGYGPLKS